MDMFLFVVFLLVFSLLFSSYCFLIFFLPIYTLKTILTNNPKRQRKPHGCPQGHLQAKHLVMGRTFTLSSHLLSHFWRLLFMLVFAPLQIFLANLKKVRTLLCKGIIFTNINHLLSKTVGNHVWINLQEQQTLRYLFMNQQKL